MMKILKSENYREGRWLNGLGLSWDIAAAPHDAGAQDFDWRMALARIDSNVAFSHYPNVDRIFTLIEGHALS
ncbi:MAG TPA: HutD family protein [Aestuariivirga sp.]|nr:HutD family protein [Aestuariivirga sp.]